MFAGAVREVGDLSDVGCGGQGLEPTDFHMHPIPDQPEFAHEGAKIVELCLVSAVQGRNGQQRFRC